MEELDTIQKYSPQKNGEHGVERCISKIINPARNWSGWTEEMKKALQSDAQNTIVGEKIVFENSQIRIWDIRLQPGQALGFHRHERPYYRTAMTAGKARAHYGDGTIGETTYHIGETQYFKDLSTENFFIHDLANIGDTELIFCTVEILQ